MDQTNSDSPLLDEAPDPNIVLGSPEWEADFDRRMELGRERRAQFVAEELARRRLT